MSRLIRAFYENGVFHPTEPVALPDHCEVEFEPRIVNGDPSTPGALDEVYAVLAERYQSGESDVAQRHNEHQQ